MARTLIDGADQIQAGSIIRASINTATTGSALMTKLIAGTGITLSQTGVDGGTGDVTASVSYGTTAGTAAQGNDARITGALSAATAAATYAALAGATFTGSVIAPYIEAGSSSLAATAQMTLASLAGNSRQIVFYSGAAARWGIAVSGETESGSNAGSNLVITGFNDAGTSVIDVITVNRASGAVALPGALTVGGTATLSGTVSGAGITSLLAPYAPMAGPNFTGYATFAGQITAQAGLVVSGGTLSGTGVNSLFATPPPVGSTTASTGAFTTLSASGTVSGAGFSSYLASPPAIGGTTAAAGSFTSLSASGNLTVGGTTTLTGALSTSGNLTVGSNTATNPYLFINAAAADPRNIAFQTAGLSRWAIYCDTAAESGSNAGCNFNIGAFSDAGGYNLDVVNINRANGLVTLGYGLTVAGATTMLGALNISGQGVPLVLNNTAGSYRLLEFTTANVVRWEMGVGNDAESGSNAGATFNITAFADSGAYIASPLSITRSSGLTSINNGLTVSGGGTTTLSGLLTALGGITVTGEVTLGAGNAGQTTIGGSGSFIGSNAIYSGSWKYIATDYAWFLRGDGATSDVVSLYVAPSGTAGAAMSQVAAFTASQTGLMTFPNGITASTSLTLGSNTAAASQIIMVNAAAGQTRGYQFQTAGVQRWLLQCTSEAETGSNTGSNFIVLGVNDANSAITAQLTINRASGLATFAGAVTAAGLTNGGVLIDTATATATPTTGGTVAIAAGVSKQIINPAGTLATLTVTSPPAPSNAAGSIQTLEITFTRAITAITWTSGSGASYAGATMPTTIAVGALVRLWWVQSLSSWMHMVPV